MRRRTLGTTASWRQAWPRRAGARHAAICRAEEWTTPMPGRRRAWILPNLTPFASCQAGCQIPPWLEGAHGARGAPWATARSRPTSGRGTTGLGGGGDASD
eukprot:5772984-Pyramimonas_sp.AAC.1